MEKIAIDKKEQVADLIERIINEEDSDITLIVPKNSVLKESVSNFHLIKREAEAAGKNLYIESVDDVVLAFAKESGLNTAHPFFEQKKGRSAFSDIVVSGDEGDARKEEAARKARRFKKDDGVPVKLHVVHSGEARGAADGDAMEAPLPRSAGGKTWKKKFGIILGVAIPVALLLLVGWLLSTVFDHATVSINFKKNPWNYDGALTADRTVSSLDMGRNIVPGELFTAQKNLTQLFPASGKKVVSLKAGATLTIFNAYSSERQSLVATTRFVTPDGKIFRLVSGVVVPGAQVKDGTIIPASIDVSVAADAAGPAYNVGPVAKLTIPGFTGSPKHNGFYGTLKQGASGGYQGEKAVPTPGDIQAAKDKTVAVLKTSLMSNLTTSYPPDFKLLEGASDVQVTKLTVNENTDQNGNFSVFAEGTLRALGFKESDVKAFLLALALKDNPGTVFDQLKVDYSGVKADFDKGILAFSISSQGLLKTAFSSDTFKSKIIGKKIGEVRSMIGQIPGLADAKVSLWPIWIATLPDTASRINVTTN